MITTFVVEMSWGRITSLKMIPISVREVLFFTSDIVFVESLKQGTITDLTDKR